MKVRISYIPTSARPGKTDYVMKLHSEHFVSLADNRWEKDCQYQGGPPNITKWCGPAFDPFDVDAGKTYMGWSI